MAVTIDKTFSSPRNPRLALTAHATLPRRAKALSLHPAPVAAGRPKPRPPVVPSSEAVRGWPRLFPGL